MDVILQDLDPREAFSDWFKANPTIRPDGRTLDEVPEISFQLGTSDDCFKLSFTPV